MKALHCLSEEIKIAITKKRSRDVTEYQGTFFDDVRSDRERNIRITKKEASASLVTMTPVPKNHIHLSLKFHNTSDQIINFFNRLYRKYNDRKKKSILKNIEQHNHHH